ncbi:MAG: hypothetical protein ACYC0V_11855 [Armatimonadota bacterium]
MRFSRHNIVLTAILLFLTTLPVLAIDGSQIDLAPTLDAQDTRLAISGYVYTVNSLTGVKIQGATVTASNGGGSTTTDSNGFYKIWVPYGYSGNITASKFGYTFDPVQRFYSYITVDQCNNNFSSKGTGLLRITGLVRTSLGQPIEGVKITDSCYTDSAGYYCTKVPSNARTATITPLKAGYSFTPSTKTYSSVSSEQFNQNFICTPSSSSVYISGYIRDENGRGADGIGVFSINKNPGVSLDYTDQYGYYEIRINSGISDTFEPDSTDGYLFSPEARTYTQVFNSISSQNYRLTLTTNPIIHGKILDNNGIAVSGVSISLINGDGSTQTGTAGDYSIEVPTGWSGTVNPAKSGYTFTPVNRSFTNVTLNQSCDFTANLDSLFIISGRITTSSGTPVSEVSMGNSSNTDADGYYSFAVQSGWSGTIMPNKNGYTFNPSSRSYSGVKSSQSYQDYTTTIAPPVTISGYVKTSAGIAVANVELASTNDGGSTSTDSSGFYSLTVTNGWTGVITPSKSGYSFNPVSRSYTGVKSNQINQNYTAGQSSPVTISGYIRASNGSAVTFAVLSASNSSISAYTNSSGYYSLSLHNGWTGTVTPSKSGYVFNPIKRSYSGIKINQTNQNYTASQSLPVTITGYVRTSNGTAVPSVTVSGSENSGSTSTNISGFYSLSVPNGWSGTVTPNKSGYIFNPANRSYSSLRSNQTSQNYTASQSTPVTISGYIKTNNGSGLSGVSIAGSNNGGSTTTNSSGFYTLSVSNGWTGVITPSKDGYIFSPASRSYSIIKTNQANQDYTATQSLPVTISGYIKLSSDTPLPLVTLTASNNGGSVITNGNGYYSLSVPNGWSGVITPERDGYTFNPADRSYSGVTTNQINQDYTATQSLPVTISGYIKTRSGTAASLVKLTASNINVTATTNNSGYYSITVPNGWSGTITPARTGLTFTPANRSYTNLVSSQSSQNYTAALSRTTR